MLRDYLERNGVACELIARDPARANLVARIRGTADGPSLMLLGHTDVVPAEPSEWRHPPFAGHLDDAGYVWGRGAADMKNEVATRAVAIAQLARSGWRGTGDLLFVAVADEEDGSEHAGMRWLVEARPDLATDYVINEGGAERLVLATATPTRISHARGTARSRTGSGPSCAPPTRSPRAACTGPTSASTSTTSVMPRASTSRSVAHCSGKGGSRLARGQQQVVEAGGGQVRL